MDPDNTSSNPDFMRKETDSGSPRILQAAIVLSILFMSPEVKEIFAQSRRSVKFKEKSSGSMERNVAPVQCSTIPCSNALKIKNPASRVFYSLGPPGFEPGTYRL